MIARSGSDRAVAGDVVGDLVEANRCLLEGTALIEAGEQQQVVDEPAHPLRFLLTAAHRVVEALSILESAAAVQLGIATHRRHRGTQLVGGVGDELLEFVFGLRDSAAKAPSRLAEHLVEGGPSCTELRIRHRPAEPGG